MRAILQLRTTTLVPVFSTIFQLAVTVVVPLAVGQLIRFLTNFEASSYPIGILGQIALLFIIFITFCQAFLNQDMQMNAHDILATVLLGELIFVTHHCIFYISYIYILKYRSAICMTTDYSFGNTILIFKISIHKHTH